MCKVVSKVGRFNCWIVLPGFWFLFTYIYIFSFLSTGKILPPLPLVKHCEAVGCARVYPLVLISKCPGEYGLPAILFQRDSVMVRVKLTWVGDALSFKSKNLFSVECHSSFYLPFPLSTVVAKMWSDRNLKPTSLSSHVDFGGIYNLQIYHQESSPWLLYQHSTVFLADTWFCCE